MADTMPAPAPDPNDPTQTTPASTPGTGFFSTMLTPVGPARPAPAGPDLATTGTAEVPVDGTTSAIYHGTSDADEKNSSNSTSTAQKKGIMRAWLIAGATRWGKGGGTQNKRLDMKKARASARQVKETRQVSINRSGGMFSGGSGSSGKGATSASGNGVGKGSGKSPANGTKNSNGSAHKGPSGRSGSNSGPGRGGASGGAAGGKQAGGSSHKQPKTDSKAPGSKGGTGGGAAPKTPNGADRKASGTSGNGKSGTPGQSGGKDHKGNRPKTSTDDGRGRISLRKDPKGPKATDQKTETKDAKGTPGASLKGTAAAKGADTKPAADTNKKINLKKKTTPDKDQTKGQEAETKGKTGQQNIPQTGERFSTRDSRETGYRDGTRIGKATAHAKAYRDGVKDGYQDITESAAQEKTRLDQAHADHKKKIEESPVPPQTSADYHQTPQAPPEPTGPQPIKVDRIDATHLQLGAGATRTVISRGEVRSLKQFERRLADRFNALIKVAETTKAFQAHAQDQAAKALVLMEQAKAVKGGDSLAGKLARFAENAKAQAAIAEHIHQRAVRSADACKATLSNVSTRYSGMYKAVVDSPETSPAEMAYYKEAN